MNVVFNLSVPREPISVPVVRHICRDSLKALGVRSECVEDIELAVTEACTNVLKHAADSEGAYRVELEVGDGVSTIRVTDAGSGFQEGSLVPGESSQPPESGRGIHLMKALVDDLRFVARPERGTVVHLEKGLALNEGSILQIAGVG